MFGTVPRVLRLTGIPFGAETLLYLAVILARPRVRHMLPKTVRAVSTPPHLPVHCAHFICSDSESPLIVA